jgi:hypothetical protein
MKKASIMNGKRTITSSTTTTKNKGKAVDQRADDRFGSFHGVDTFLRRLWYISDEMSQVFAQLSLIVLIGLKI